MSGCYNDIGGQTQRGALSQVIQLSLWYSGVFSYFQVALILILMIHLSDYALLFIFAVCRRLRSICSRNSVFLRCWWSSCLCWRTSLANLSFSKVYHSRWYNYYHTVSCDCLRAILIATFTDITVFCLSFIIKTAIFSSYLFTYTPVWGHCRHRVMYNTPGWREGELSLILVAPEGD